MDSEKNNTPPDNQVLFEDLVQYANQYTYGAHPSGRMPGNKKMTVLDLLRVGDEDDDKAPKILPFQMNTFIESLGDVYVQVVEVQKMLATAYKSPLTKDSDKLKQSLGKINKNLQHQKKLIKDCGKIIDKLHE